MKTNRFVFLLLGLAAGFAYAADVVRNRRALEPGRPDFRRRRAGGGKPFPAGANASAMRVTVGKRDVTAAFGGARRRPLSRPDRGPRAGPERRHGEAPRWPRRAHHHHQLSQRRAGVQRPAGFSPGRCNPGASDALCTRAPSYQYFLCSGGHRPAGDAGTSSARLGRRMRTSCLTTRPILRPLR